MNKEQALSKSKEVTLLNVQVQTVGFVHELLGDLRQHFKFLIVGSSDVGDADRFIKKCEDSDGVWKVYSEEVNRILGFKYTNTDKFMELVEMQFRLAALRKIVNEVRLLGRSSPKLSKRF